MISNAVNLLSCRTFVVFVFDKSPGENELSYFLLVSGSLSKLYIWSKSIKIRRTGTDVCQGNVENQSLCD